MPIRTHNARDVVILGHEKNESALLAGSSRGRNLTHWTCGGGEKGISVRGCPLFGGTDP